MTRYVNAHEWQYARTNSDRTRKSGCTWLAGACGADASTGGRVNPTPDAVLAKVKPSEETSPATPGWSMGDLALAMSRLGVPFEDRSGKGWAGVVAARKAGQYVVLQGDSDRFADGCSGAFDGDHAVGIHPDNDRLGRWRIDDSICLTATYQGEAVLRAYAEKFAPSVRFGVFLDPVPSGDDMGLDLRPIGTLVAGTADVAKGVEVIYSKDRRRAKTTAAATNRQATGRYDPQEIGGPQEGYEVAFADGMAWVRVGDGIDFTPSVDPKVIHNDAVAAAEAAALAAIRKLRR